MERDSIIELQKIDCNCNDCKYMQRDIVKFKSFNYLFVNEKGQVTSPAYRSNYGHCKKFDKAVSFIPNTCQLDTQECFEHRRD